MPVRLCDDNSADGFVFAIQPVGANSFCGEKREASRIYDLAGRLGAAPSRLSFGNSAARLVRGMFEMPTAKCARNKSSMVNPKS